MKFSHCLWQQFDTTSLTWLSHRESSHKAKDTCQAKAQGKSEDKFDTAARKSAIRLYPLATARGCSLKVLGTSTHTHTHVSRAMSIMFKYLVRLQRVVLCLLWDLLRSHKRSGTDALKPRSRPFKYGPEPNALSQPHSLYCIVLHCIVLYWYLYLYLYCMYTYIYICIIIIYYILSYIIFEWAHSRPLWCAEFQRDQDLWGMPRV